MANSFPQNIGKEVVYMTYGNAEERSSLLAGLHDLANFLERNPAIPVPRWADVMVFPPPGTDVELKAEINRIAALIGAGINDQTAAGGHYTVSRKFGPVQYEAVGITSQWRVRRDARTSYTENVIVSANTEEA
jgi:hypothetical protein